MNNQQVLEQLNDPQRLAVTAPVDQNLLVLAGAGSGKTRVLIYRIWWLIKQGIDCNNILAVTFTNKAAAEMRKRLDEMLTFKLSGIWMGTFHSLAHRLLRIHWQEASLPQSFQVMDSDDQLRLLRRIHKNLNLDEDKWPVRKSQSFINNSKDKCLRAEQISVHHLADKTLIKIYSDYEDICNLNGVVDFSELLLRSYELLIQHPELLNFYKRRFQQVLVDEFQDTNGIQYLWIKLLAKDSSNIMAVGDDDQSIYSWRGANVENIQQFSLDFANSSVIRLEQNYRSTSNILQAANAVIARNKNRLGKNLWTSGDVGELISLYTAFNEIDEARYIAATIQKYLNEGIKCKDIAILYRSNAQSRALEAQLTYSQIPYVIYGGLRFYDRAEIKDILAYLRLVVNRNDDAAFERIINVPARGIGDTTLIAIRDYARNFRLPMWQALSEMIAKNMLNNRALKAVSGFTDIIEEIYSELEKLEIFELIDYAAKISGLRVHLAKEKNISGQGRLENLDELIAAAEQFSLIQDADSKLALLNLFLTNIFLESSGEEGQKHDSNDAIHLMTLHSAKGLEFPYVFISGMEEGMFPHAMSLSSGTEEEIEEERRLCYVGMTRAMKKLHLINAESRQVYGTSSFRRPSRFLREIPEYLLAKTGMSTVVSKPIITEHQSQNAHKFEDAAQQSSGDFSVGQKVFHNKFGEGIVLNFEGEGANALIQIKFIRHGTKLLAMSVAKLTTL